jgi:hypothetical protein
MQDSRKPAGRKSRLPYIPSIGCYWNEPETPWEVRHCYPLPAPTGLLMLLLELLDRTAQGIRNYLYMKLLRRRDEIEFRQALVHRRMLARRKHAR